jgi:hypothetical protein
MNEKKLSQGNTLQQYMTRSLGPGTRYPGVFLPEVPGTCSCIVTGNSQINVRPECTSGSLSNVLPYGGPAVVDGSGRLYRVSRAPGVFLLITRYTAFNAGVHTAGDTS